MPKTQDWKQKMEASIGNAIASLKSDIVLASHASHCLTVACSFTITLRTPRICPPVSTVFASGRKRLNLAGWCFANVAGKV
jgi:hypothetical protein